MSALPWALALALALSACSPSQPLQRSLPKASPPAPGASPTASQASASPAPPALQPQRTLRLPLRLGQALPPSVVGALAASRLVGGQGERVAAPLTTLSADAQGRLVSNNGGNGVATPGAGLIANHGGSFRLSQGGIEASLDPRAELWLMVGFLDYLDQLLQAYAQSGPQLGRWQRFQAQSLTILPPPAGAEVFALAAAQMEQSLQAQHLAGLSIAQADGLELRMVLLPGPEAPWSKAQPLAQIKQGTQGPATLRLQLPALMLQAFGLKAGRLKGEITPEGELVAEHGEVYLPVAERGPLSQAIHGSIALQAIRRRIAWSRPGQEPAWLKVSRGELQDRQGPWHFRTLSAFGFRGKGQELGVASYHRSQEGPVGGVSPFAWFDLRSVPMPEPPAGQGAGRFQGPAGEELLAASPELAALLPPYGPQDEAAIPLAPSSVAAIAEDPSLAMPELPASWLALPEGPAP